MVRQLRTDLAIIDNQSVNSKTLPENRGTYGYKKIKAHKSYIVTNTMEIPLGVQTTMLRRPIIKQPTNYWGQLASRVLPSNACGLRAVTKMIFKLSVWNQFQYQFKITIQPEGKGFQVLAK